MHKLYNALFVFILLIVSGAPATAKEPQTIPACEAGEHIGEAATIQGTVVQVSTSKKGTVFINFGRPYPKQCFFGVIFTDKVSRFDDVQLFNGKTCTLTGTIQIYKYGPEIVLSDPQQIQCKR